MKLKNENFASFSILRYVFQEANFLKREEEFPLRLSEKPYLGKLPPEL
jgi:hypothetical protein